jgi:outer membrane protein TolC
MAHESHRAREPITRGAQGAQGAPAALLLASLGFVGGALALAAGCRSADEWSAQADREVYELVLRRRQELLAAPDRFSVEPPEHSLRERLLAGDVDARARLAGLDFAECLEIAGENSRDLADQRERLYLAALDVTLERWDFAVQESGVLSASLSDGSGLDPEADAGAGLGLAKLFGSGALLVADLGLDFARNLASGDVWSITSDASLTLTQPLLRGFGAEIVRESLTQAERGLVYEARAYERFRRTFAVDVARRVYRILQQMDEVENERSNADNLGRLRERNEALGGAGRLADIQVDQARQDELRARSRVIQAEQRLQQSLDDLKLFLGLPVELELSVDPAELGRLASGADTAGERGAAREAWLAAAEASEESSVRRALAGRLDHRTVEERVEDGERGVRVAADALRLGLDLSASVAGTSQEGQPLDYDGPSSISASLALDLPLERLPERNALRRAELDLQAALRARSESRDRVASEVRDALRQLRARRDDRDIQERSVELAERRVASTLLNFEAGRAETRDLLDAQEALVTAQNAATAALIDQRLAELDLELALEALQVDERGLTIADGASAPPAPIRASVEPEEES